MDVADLLADAFDRIKQSVHGTVDGLTEEQLAYRVDGKSNSIAWLVWHLTRIQDDHIADVAQTDQVWPAWYDRFDLPFDVSEHGYGQSSEQVAAVRAPAELLIGYHDAVHEATLRYVRTLTPGDLDIVVDENWDPPVTLGVRLISVVNDDTQHIGQAAFLRGLLP
jgi:hypothetical protein